MAALAEKTTQGILKTAEPWALLVEDIPEASKESAKAEEPKRVTPPPKIASTIELLDRQLRERCLDLFDKFSKEGQSSRYDTVISEATRILEV